MKLMYLGHAVSDKGTQTDPKKVDAIQKWPNPTTITKYVAFFGLLTIITDSSRNMHR